MSIGMKADVDYVRVLLIDDSEDDAIIARAMLSRVRGVVFEEEWVPTFDEGVRKLKENTHDVCLLDYCLGKETGLDVLRETLKFGCRVPIIMLTGTNNQEIDIQAIKLGAADYVVKGETNPDLMERAIRHARERKRARTERELLNQQLVESSRLAGMGEVASHILHNVGNVLNSINVSAGLVSQYLHEMPIDDISRIAHLLEDHKDDVSAFLTSHPKGKRIPLFLNQVEVLLRQHFTDANKELEGLVSQLDHVNQIMATQKTLANATQVVEPVILGELIEQALLMNQPGFETAGIAITREILDVPQVLIDRHQVLQILFNLIRNAKDAMQAQGVGSHRLTLLMVNHPDREGFVRIQVGDTGIGICPEHQTRIFAQTFGTNKKGKGLHGCALAAKKLGGSLTAWSAGTGHGATFSLDLPMKTPEVIALS
ncbi:MAG TPA: hypothetical protein DD706_13180 [Nitrospiraceae bacterium]|nr:hypothetical protein [Nitrospiraceae bacterium]